MDLLKKIFDNKGSLTIEGRILYVHAMHLTQIDDLPEELIDYVWENSKSRKEIAELYELLDKEMVQQNPHPYLRSIGNPSFVAIDWSNLDTAMENLLREALSEQSAPNRKLERKMAISFKAPNTTFKVLRPLKDTVCVQQILFQFSQPTPQPKLLHLKNAKGQGKGEFEIPSNSKEFIVSLEDVQQFPTGLYYWTLLVNGTPITNRLYICTEAEARGLLSSNG